MNHARQLSPSAAITSGAENPFRRSRATPKRRRKSKWLPLLRRTMVPLFLLVLTTGGTTWLMSSPRFGLTGVEVLTSDRVAATWVSSRLAPLAGENLVRLELSAIEGRINDHPWLAGVAISKELPDRLRVEIEEKVPVALVPLRGELWYATASGEAIAPYDSAADSGSWIQVSGPGAPGDEPTEQQRRGVAEALRVATELELAAPDWRQALTSVEVLGNGDFQLQVSTLPFPLLVRAGGLESKIGYLKELLPEILGRYVALSAVDLRFSRRIVLQPGTEPAEAGGTRSS